MADSDDQIEASAKKYGWSPSEVAYYKSLRGDIPQAMPSASPQAGATPNAAQTQSGQLNPQNIDPQAAANVAKAFAHGGTVHGVTGGGSVMFGNTVIADHQRPALGYDNAPNFSHGGRVPIDSPPQLPGLEEQQQMDMKQKALKKLRGS